MLLITNKVVVTEVRREAISCSTTLFCPAFHAIGLLVAIAIFLLSLTSYCLCIRMGQCIIKLQTNENVQHTVQKRLAAHFNQTHHQIQGSVEDQKRHLYYCVSQ